MRKVLAAFGVMRGFGLYRYCNEYTYTDTSSLRQANQPLLRAACLMNRVKHWRLLIVF